MADTRQIVQWSLEQSCALRATREAETETRAVLESISKARAYSDGLRNRADGFGVYGDVYVSSYTFGARPAGRERVYYPTNGFLISREFAVLGGPEALFRMCHDCPANVRGHEIAVCAGSLYQWPSSTETEEQLRGIIARRGLEADVAAHFPVTDPLWYGLWAVSPVPSASLPTLKILLSEMLVEDTSEKEKGGNVLPRQLRDFANAVAAIEIAERRGLRLHVQLLPLGHTDFGLYTVFPHCPFCKAPARVARWQRKYPSELYPCEVCGTQFSPAETATVERMKLDREELSEQLGPEAFREFVREYLIDNGEAPESVDGIIAATEASEREREAIRTRHLELYRRRDAYLDAHVFAGLPTVPPPPAEYPADDEKDETEPPLHWFDAAALAEILRRCEHLGIAVTILQHRSTDDDLDRHASGKISSPRELLEKWQSEGCREKFRVVCKVPDSLLSPGDTTG